MIKKEFAYKVVRKEGKKLVSAWIPDIISLAPATVEYKVGKWVTSKKGNGPLGIFESKKAAIIFKCSFCPTGLIYKCQIQKSEQSIFWFLNIYGIKQISHGVGNTIFADKVKSLKRVK
jgi:hypothetical protein